jgi:squalene-associated FAD-dependent desaturase
MTDHPRIAVIGGGWAGMAAASRLASDGLGVDVYEAARVLGGRARRVEIDGVALDNGLHLLLGAYTESLACLERVGVPAGSFLRTPLKLDAVDGFRLDCPPIPAPWHLVAGLLGARGIGWSDRLAAARLIQSAKRNRFRCNGQLSVVTLLDDHRQPARLREALWYPLCVAALNTPPEIADAQVFLHVLRDGLAGARDASDLVFPAVDLSAMFPEPAADFVDARGGNVYTSEAVNAIDGNGPFTIRTARRSAAYAQVICAVDPARLAPLLRDLPALADVATRAAALRHAPIVSVYLDYGIDVRLRSPMIGLGEGPGEWVFDRQRLCGQRGWLGVVISASDRWTGTPHEALTRQVERQLTAQLAMPQAAQRTRVIVEKRATFLCTPGVDRPSQRTALPGFHLAGDYTASDYPATLEAAVRSGLACAQAVLENT